MAALDSGFFDAGVWLAQHPGAGCDPVHVSQPVQLGSGWTKAPAAAATSGGAGSGGGSRFCHGDTSGLLPFVLPRLPASLEEGAYVAKDQEEEDVGVETVVRAAAAAGASLADCEVVTYRNNLNKIFGTPFDPKAGWTVDACLLPPSGSPSSSGGSSSSSGPGPLFLDIVKVEQSWSGNRADLERFTRWGYRFEALCTGQEVADSTSEYGVLVRTRIAQHRLYIGAEIDCYDPSLCPPEAIAPPGTAAGSAAAATEAAAVAMQPGSAGSGQQGGAAPPVLQARQQQGPVQQAPSLGSYIELKTYRVPQHQQQQRNLYRYKHPKWWLQSFLAGVPRLALGGRDDEGTVRRIDLVATTDLPRISAQAGAAFSPNQALSFGTEVLAWMRAEAARRPGQHLRFCYDGSSDSYGSGGGGGRAQNRRGGGTVTRADGVISCTVVAGGALPERVAACLHECQLTL